MRRLLALAVSLSACSALPQSIAPVEPIIVENDDTLLYLEEGSAPYSDAALTISSIPDEFEGTRLIPTLHADRGSDDETVLNSIDVLNANGGNVIVWHGATTEPQWLVGYTKCTTKTIAVSDGTTLTAYTKAIPNGIFSWQGNTTAGDTTKAMYLLSILPTWRQLLCDSGTAPTADAGNYYFTTTSGADIPESSTSNRGGIRRENGTDGVRTVETYVSGGTCVYTTDFTITTTPLTRTFQDGNIAPDESSMEIVANDVSGDCTVILGFQNPSAGFTAAAHSQTHTFTIVDSPASTPDLTVCAAGCDYTTTDAAMEAAGPGDIIELRAATPGGTFTDTSPIVVANAGSAGNLITTRCRSGDTCIVSGVEAKRVMFLTGDYHDFGGNGIQVRGSDIGINSDADRSLQTQSSNNIFRDLYLTHNRLHSFWSIDGTNNVLRDSTIYLSGGLDDGDPVDPEDYGDNLEFQGDQALGYGNHTVYNTTIASVGHKIMQNVHTSMFSDIRCENLWDQEDDPNNPGVTDDGNRCFTLAQASSENFVRWLVSGPVGVPYGGGGNVSLGRFSGERNVIQHSLFVGNRGHASGWDVSMSGGQFMRDNYFVQVTTTDHDGACFHGNSGKLGTGDYTQWGPLTLINVLCWDVNKSSDPEVTHPTAVELDYDGDNQTPCDVLFIYGSAFENGAIFRFDNRRPGGPNTDYTLAQFETACPGNVRDNISIGDPLFVDSTIPRVSRPPNSSDAITYNTAAYEDYEPTLAAVLGTGTYVTELNGAASTATFTVDDSWMLHAPGPNGIVGGNEIFVEGHGAVTITAINYDTHSITVDETVTAADGANVYLGNSATPNIGWWQGDGNYGAF